MSDQSSTTAFLRWALVAPAIVIVVAIFFKLQHTGNGIGYGLPFIGIGVAFALCVLAPLQGLATRTAIASLLGVFAGLIFAFMLATSIL